jgi:hypothetical protein
MESFILEPTSKIDFGCSTAIAHLIGLQRKYHVSEQLWNSIPNSCSFRCPRASIYRLGCRMGVRQSIPRSRLDDGQGTSGRTIVRQDFSKNLRRNLSCIRTSSGWDGTSSEWSHVRCKQFPYQALEHPDHEG